VASFRLTPTPRAPLAVTALLLLATLPPRSSRLLDLLLAMLGSLVVLAFVLAVTALRGLRLERELPATGTRGASVPLVERLVNDSGSPAFAIAVSERGIGGAARAVFFPVVPPAGRAEARGKLRLAARGLLRLEAASLEATDPFGFFRASRVVGVPGEVLVTPRPRRLAARRLLEAARRGHSAGPRGARGTRSAEPLSVREYRHGDSPRDMHWRLSAHTGTLVVKTFQAEQNHDALIVLDRVPPGLSPEGLAAFERAVSLAAGLGLEILDGGGEVAFAATGTPPVRLERLRGRAGRTALLAALALVEPSRDPGPELPEPGSRRRDAFLVTARGPRSGTLPVPGPGGVRVVAVEGGPGPRSSQSVSWRRARGGAAGP
jgi:uncharacterized protein (DUF58 family)